jgi:hypothetical protein
MSISPLPADLPNSKTYHFAILTSVHTRYVAQLLQQRLHFHGATVQIFTAYSSAISADIFIVVCAQIFPELPPADRRIIFQMEQSTSTRWFTPSYLDDLRDSRAVLDYSLANILALNQSGIPNGKMHYLPIGANPQLTFTPASSKSYDFIFYGDYSSSERRQNFVQALQQKYSVLILQDVFEEDLYHGITSAKAVINLHYYENPLLETTRICECLSLGMPVLSEATPDTHYYPEFNSAVTYFKENSVDDLMIKAQWFLENLPSQESIRNAAIQSETMFNNHFDQAFYTLGLLPIKGSRKSMIQWLKMFHR